MKILELDHGENILLSTHKNSEDEDSQVLKFFYCIILFFIGAKMLLGWYEPISHFFHQYSWVSLAVIVCTLLFSIILSKVISEEVKEEECLQAKLDESDKK